MQKTPAVLLLLILLTSPMCWGEQDSDASLDATADADADAGAINDSYEEENYNNDEPDSIKFASLPESLAQDWEVYHQKDYLHQDIPITNFRSR